MSRVDTWESIPDFGDHMTVEEFAEEVQSGCFTDYDGIGHPATAKAQLQTARYLSVHELLAYAERRPFITHIVWYNR